MLPFLKPKTVAGAIMSVRKPDGGMEDMAGPEDSAPDAGMEACAEDIMRAIASKDAKAFAVALRAAFEMMESEPHEEAGNSFDDMNAKAAKDQG